MLLPIGYVSILGLVDKRLRLNIEFTSMNQSIDVSILGLVDKRLRLEMFNRFPPFKTCFNPWFSG